MPPLQAASAGTSLAYIEVKGLQTMSNFKLQTVLAQLAELTPAELGKVKEAVHAELDRQMRAIGANGGLTHEEWDLLEKKGGLSDCVKMVRMRTGLGLVEAKAYVDRARSAGVRPYPLR
jgi:ribosomal protein L7/L12